MIKIIAVLFVAYMVFVLLGRIVLTKFLDLAETWHEMRPNRVTSLASSFAEVLFIVWVVVGMYPSLWLIGTIDDMNFWFQNSAKPWMRRQWMGLRDWWTH